MTVPQYAEHGHLGGYIIGGDYATYCPELWSWLVNIHGVRSVIDVGCGEGHALRYFSNRGLRHHDLVGVDGVNLHDEWEIDANFICHDYTRGKLGVKPTSTKFDLCWSCEFVEHVEERYIPNFLETFSCAHMILMTHAEPGQSGYHHVNCQPADYWIGWLETIAFTLDAEMTARTRALAPGTHYARSGLAFVPSA